MHGRLVASSWRVCTMHASEALSRALGAECCRWAPAAEAAVCGLLLDEGKSGGDYLGKASVSLICLFIRQQGPVHPASDRPFPRRRPDQTITSETFTIA